MQVGASPRGGLALVSWPAPRPCWSAATSSPRRTSRRSAGTGPGPPAQPAAASCGCAGSPAEDVVATCSTASTYRTDDGTERGPPSIPPTRGCGGWRGRRPGRRRVRGGAASGRPGVAVAVVPVTLAALVGVVLAERPTVSARLALGQDRYLEGASVVGDLVLETSLPRGVPTQWCPSRGPWSSNARRAVWRGRRGDRAPSVAFASRRPRRVGHRAPRTAVGAGLRTAGARAVAGCRRAVVHDPDRAVGGHGAGAAPPSRPADRGRRPPRPPAGRRHRVRRGPPLPARGPAPTRTGPSALVAETSG